MIMRLARPAKMNGHVPWVYLKRVRRRVWQLTRMRGTWRLFDWTVGVMTF